MTLGPMAKGILTRRRHSGTCAPIIRLQSEPSRIKLIAALYATPKAIPQFRAESLFTFLIIRMATPLNRSRHLQQKNPASQRGGV